MIFITVLQEMINLGLFNQWFFIPLLLQITKYHKFPCCQRLAVCLQHLAFVLASMFWSFLFCAEAASTNQCLFTCLFTSLFWLCIFNILVICCLFSKVFCFCFCLLQLSKHYANDLCSFFLSFQLVLRVLLLIFIRPWNMGIIKQIPSSALEGLQLYGLQPLKRTFYGRFFFFFLHNFNIF